MPLGRVAYSLLDRLYVPCMCYLRLRNAAQHVVIHAVLSSLRRDHQHSEVYYGTIERILRCDDRRHAPGRFRENLNPIIIT